MIEQIDKLIKSFEGKTSLSSKEMTSKLTSLSHSIEKSIDDGCLININSSKKIEVDEIKTYDIIYMSVLGGVPHYLLVHKVEDDKVYCLVLTSTYKEHIILCQIENDRTFKGNYVSNSYFCLPLEDAKKSFIRTYEDKREAVRMFNKLSAYYKKLFKN
jgi:hypothetical protein